MQQERRVIQSVAEKIPLSCLSERTQAAAGMGCIAAKRGEARPSSTVEGGLWEKEKKIVCAACLHVCVCV